MDTLAKNLTGLDGKTLAQYAEAFGVALGVTLSLWLVVHLVRRRFAQTVEKSATRIDDIAFDVLGRTKLLFLIAAGVGVAAWAFDFPAKLEKTALTVTWLVTFVQLGIWGSALARHIIERRFDQANLGPEARTGTGVISIGAVVLVWTAVALLALDNLGIDVTALIAGLGVGGVAIALATQNILGDVFASVSILLDKPFVVGDFVVVGDFMGTVEHIGIKTTRLRSLSGEQLIFSNNDLLQSRIRNFKRMTERRGVFIFNIAYQTAPEKLERIPVLVRGIIEKLPYTRFDRSHFMGYGDFALQFETVFFVLTPDYNQYADLRQKMNLDIMKAFAAEGVAFAYPTQQVYVEQGGPAKVAREAASKA